MKRFVFSILLLGITASLGAQNSKYWVFLKDKKNVTFDPYAYFDKKTIDRRISQGISLIDSTDFPLNPDYVSAVNAAVDSVTQCSRWFNTIAVYAKAEQIEMLKKLSFVLSVEPMYMDCYPASLPDAGWDTTMDDTELEILKKQISAMGGDLYGEAGIDGKGVRIAIFDGGFPTVDVNPAFEHIRKDGRIIKTWDFTKNREYAYTGISHGTSVMSCIAGIVNGKKIGMATGAEFLLARTEIRSEPFSEEENWLAAVEWADKNGADIINSSLGYTYHRYFNNQMDGKTSLVARAGNLAARKGILVVNAAGNEGDNDWQYIGTPADADSVLSVGGVSPWTNYHISYSSFGPTSDGRLKPNVCAVAHVVAATKNGMSEMDGTSFASPLTAGFAACALQVLKGISSMQLFNEIQKSGSLYPYFDYAHGYGIPQASYFLDTAIVFKEQTFSISESETGTLEIKINSGFLNKDKDAEQALLYYNIQQADGELLEYYVIGVYQENVLTLYKNDYPKGCKLNIHYKGYTDSLQF